MPHENEIHESKADESKEQPVIMSYADPAGQKHAHVLKLEQRAAVSLLIRTIRWASHHNVEIHIKPV